MDKAKIKLLIPLYLGLILAAIALGQIQHQQPEDWGWQWNLDLVQAWAWGVAIAAFTIALVYGMEMLFGWVEWQPKTDWWRLICLIVPLALLVGGVEELIFRGYLQYQLEAQYGLLGAGAIASTIFALSHLIWDRQQTLPQLPGLWLMGMVLLGAKWADGNSLGLAIGLHCGWVWCLACIDATKVFSYTKTSPEWFVGIGKQPLAGLAGILCLLVTAITLWATVKFDYIQQFLY